jgi:hypothetical protein
MRSLTRSPDLSVHVICGNHDQRTDHAHDHAIAPLTFARNITVYDSVAREVLIPGTDGLAVAFIPFKAAPAREYLIEAMKQKSQVQHSVFVAHAGIIEQKTPVFLRGAHDALPLSDVLHEMSAGKGFTHGFVGNWHLPRKWETTENRTLVQCGALCPTGFDNPGYDNGFMWVLKRGGEVEKHNVYGPRFLKLVYDDVDFDELANEINTEALPVYISMQADPLLMKRAKAELLDLHSKTCRLLKDYKVTPNVEMANQQARVAARGARTATSIESAVAAYVAKMAVGEGVKRDNVLAHVRRFLS